MEEKESEKRKDITESASKKMVTKRRENNGVKVKMVESETEIELFGRKLDLRKVAILLAVVNFGCLGYSWWYFVNFFCVNIFGGCNNGNAVVELTAGVVMLILPVTVFGWFLVELSLVAISKSRWRRGLFWVLIVAMLLVFGLAKTLEDVAMMIGVCGMLGLVVALVVVDAVGLRRRRE